MTARNVVPHRTYKESVECSRSVMSQRNLIGVLPEHGMWCPISLLGSL